MKKSEWPPVYERLEPFIEDAARTHYGGDREKGFKFWAASQVLMDTDLSDDQLKEPLLLDGRGDLGLDGYYEDPETETLTLIQSKFHDQPVAISNEDLNRFFSCLRKVLNPEVVVAAKNPLAQDAHRAARDAIKNGWTLRFIFLTSGYLSPEGRTFTEVKATETEVIDSIEIRKDLDVYDLERLQELYESHLTPARFNTDVELDISSEDFNVSTIAGFRVLVGSIPARELVRAFRQHQYALFRLNPRGPLQNRINSNIMATLKDPSKRKLFFHLNNGVTAVCETFRSDRKPVTVRDFQIVNGCQTTVTLVKAAAIVEANGDIRVLLRLIEGLANLRDQIATATNTQARLSAQDFKSNDPLQKDLKNQFDALPAPILYEVKRGDWEMEQSKERYWDNESKVHRRIKMKDLAQATLAFLGEPGDAKDRSRSIFENQSRYKKVFPDNVRAQQLLLPWTVYQEANRACLQWSAFLGADYARYCLTALVGFELAPAKELPSLQEAPRLAAHSERIRASLTRGQQAIAGLIAALDPDYPGHREFFRSADFFEKVLKAYRAQPS
ncbi:MAG: AIPR family protein [Chloroflexota bacterium]|nr:AIPR family protein [Chloroflexota bacterium]